MFHCAFLCTAESPVPYFSACPCLTKFYFSGTILDLFTSLIFRCGFPNPISTIRSLSPLPNPPPPLSFHLLLSPSLPPS